MDLKRKKANFHVQVGSDALSCELPSDEIFIIFLIRCENSKLRSHKKWQLPMRYFTFRKDRRNGKEAI